MLCYILLCQPISYTIMSVSRYISTIKIHQHSWMLGMREAPVLASHSMIIVHIYKKRTEDPAPGWLQQTTAAQLYCAGDRMFA